VILARHGQTVFNRDNFVMGRSDSPLTEEGARTAKELAQLLMSEGVAAILSSPLGRAVSSANLYAEAFGLSVKVRDGIAELSCGQWEGKLRSSVTQNALKLREAWGHRPPDGESYKDAEPRVSAVIREIRSENVPPVALVVGHAGISRVFLKLWMELTEDLAMSIMFPHDIVYMLGGGDGVRVRSAAGEEFIGLLLDTESRSGNHQRSSS